MRLMNFGSRKLTGLALVSGMIVFLSSCTTLQKWNEDTKSIQAWIMDCPDDMMESEYGLPDDALSALGSSTYLDRMFAGIKTDFEKSGVEFEKIARGFKGLGIQLEKIKDQKGNETRELLISIDGDMSFDTGSSALTDKANTLVDRISKAMNAYPQTTARIGGHTDSVGRFKLNKRLSYARAVAVRDRLIKSYAIDPDRFVSIEGFADQQKIEDTNGPSKKNRRVEIRLVAESKARTKEAQQ